MGNCKDCQHWHRIRFECLQVCTNYENDQPIPEDKEFRMDVTFNDDQGLDVGLKTGPLFGCVEFEAKE